MIDYTYNDTEYYGYKGKSVYHFSTDGSTLMYSEFQTTASSVKEGQEIQDTISKKITTDLLKKEMGFDGVIITDGITMGGLIGIQEILSLVIH